MKSYFVGLKLTTKKHTACVDIFCVAKFDINRFAIFDIRTCYAEPCYCVIICKTNFDIFSVCENEG